MLGRTSLDPAGDQLPESTEDDATPRVLPDLITIYLFDRSRATRRKAIAIRRIARESLPLHRLPLSLGPLHRKRQRVEPPTAEQVLVEKELRVDAVRAIVPQLASEAIEPAEKLEQPFVGLWRGWRAVRLEEGVVTHRGPRCCPEMAAVVW